MTWLLLKMFNIKAEKQEEKKILHEVGGKRGPYLGKRDGGKGGGGNLSEAGRGENGRKLGLGWVGINYYYQ